MFVEPSLVKEDSSKAADDASHIPTDKEATFVKEKPRPKPRMKGKGKEKEKEEEEEEEERWVQLKGSQRCAQCLGRSLPVCVVDEGKLEKWEKDVAAGKEFTKSPAGVACQECRSKKHFCLLPRSEAMRMALPEKRKREKDVAEGDAKEVGGSVDQPAPKKSRKQGRAAGIGENAGIDETSGLDEAALLDFGERMLKALVEYSTEQRRFAAARVRTANALEGIAFVMKHRQLGRPRSDGENDDREKEAGDEPMQE
jgi:hypothetical protein